MIHDFFHRKTTAPKTRVTQEVDSALTTRLHIFAGCIFMLLGCLLARLGYWQLIKGADLRAVAANQYQRRIAYEGQRGAIYTADNFLLVSNEPVFNLFGQPHLLDQPASELSRQLLPYLTPYIVTEWEKATPSGTLAQAIQENQTDLITKLSRTDTKWVSLFKDLRKPDMEAIKSLNLRGITFEEAAARRYPEASMAAQVLGFVGHNAQGEATGYFGVEGALNKELQSPEELRTIEADALGGRLGSAQDHLSPHGRDVILTIRRDIQHMAETALKAGLERYGAAAGEVIIMQPKTGRILAMASYPNYDPGEYQHYDPAVYKNPSVSSLYEPGSTFKTLTVAAGIDAGVITPETQCPRCETARTISGYRLKTWNDQYTPNITMTDALAKSDNTAMIFIAEELGAQRFGSYLQRFGIGQPSQVELQEDTSAHFPEKWGPVELATRSFGQGISTTSLQLLKAINAIANQGKLMRPLIVEKVSNPATQEVIEVPPFVEAQVISPQTAQTVTQMMINAAGHGEAQWTASRTHIVAGKTGTAQIAIDGKYDSSKTIASFVGFAPAHDPQFIMLVKLTEPTSSPWAAETAAPLWYQIANKLYLLLHIPPDIQPVNSSLHTPSTQTTEVTLD